VAKPILLVFVSGLSLRNMGGWWRWALVSPDGVAPSRTVSVSASVNLSLHHKVQKFSSGTGSPGWSQKKGRKTVVVVVVVVLLSLRQLLWISSETGSAMEGTPPGGGIFGIENFWLLHCHSWTCPQLLSCRFQFFP